MAKKSPAVVTHDELGKMPSYLQRRGARYHVRRRTPKDLIHHYKKLELGRALGTSDPHEARRLLPYALAEWQREFDALRAAKVAHQPIPAAAGSAIRQMGPLRSSTQSYEEFEWEIENALQADRFISQIEHERDERADREAELLSHVRDAPRSALTTDEAIMRDLLLDRQQDLDLAHARLAMHAGDQGMSPQVTVSDGSGVISAAEPHSSSIRSLHQAHEVWAAERRRDPKTVDTYRRAADWFVERVGHKGLEAVTSQDVRTFALKLQAEGQGPANINVILGRVRTLLGVALKQGWTSANPALGVTVAVSSADRKVRKPFGPQELKAIFTSPVYVDDLRPTEGRGEAAYWLPLLGLYTGARLEELGQLRPLDVRQETYIDAADQSQTAWVIQVVRDDEAGLKVKNEGSVRLIPVHAALVELGFLEYAEQAKASGHPRLFPELRPNKYGRLTAKWGEWFSEYKRDVCGVTGGEHVFHSFRHTFKRFARRAMIAEGIQRGLMGHAPGDQPDRYGDGYDFFQLVEGMAEYRVPAFDLPRPPPAFR